MTDSLAAFREGFADKILKFEEKNPRRFYIDIDPSNLIEIAGYLFTDLGYRYVVASGLDRRDAIEILYHFSEDAAGRLVSLRVQIPDKDKPRINSLTPVIKGISWIEREMHELLGIDFIGHPNLKHLLLPEDWPEGNFPLRNDQNRDQVK